ncbi:unnamed protein product [Enterobius vermicularis]|uniref:Saposin B-type domain-containing protein n=1 Tax=Enterobius vermicularis TaxID=51028 RepID=A0A0N4VJ57_ENTVE|nr:unnamed protein product [Enterobius vermicularis]
MRTLIVLSAVIAAAFALVEQDPLLDALICNVCVDMVTKAESAGLDYSENWLKNKFDEACEQVGVFKTICVIALQYVMTDLDKHIRGALSPRAGCEKVTLCKKN